MKRNEFAAHVFAMYHARCEAWGCRTSAMGAMENRKSQPQGNLEYLRAEDVPYRVLAERVPMVIYLDALGEAALGETSSTFYVSPQVEGMLGHTQEEWLGDPRSWVESLHPDDRERVLYEHEYARERGEAFASEYRMISRDGRVVWVRDEATLLRDEKGNPRFWQGVAVDVTDRKAAEEARREAEDMFRETFETVAVGMAHTTPEGRFLRVNQRFCEIVNREREELLVLTFWDITPPEEMDAARKRLRRILDGETDSYTIERRYIRKDGSRVWARLGVSLIRKTSGEPNYFLCVADDITERKLAEYMREPLTNREIEVLVELAGGKTNREISKTLRYSLGTVKLDIQKILAKLGAENRWQAADRAVEIGLIKPPRR